MTKTNTRSRIVSILLVLMMLLTMVPITGVTASAAEPEWTIVYSYEDLQKAINNKKEYIKLGRDIDTNNFHYSGSGITIDEWLTFEGQTCTLDLNGKTLTLITKMRNMGTFMRVYSGSNLTIKDSSSTRTGEITCDFDANFSGDNSAYMIHVSESSLTLEGGTFRATSHPYATSCNAIQSIDSNLTIKDGVKLIQPDYFDGGGDSVETGSGYALRAELNKGNTSKIIIDGGEFDGCVKLTGSQGENGSVQINGGTFKKIVQVMYAAEENNSDPAVAVNGGTFEGNVYLQGWPWKKSLYMPYRLNGGTFYGSLNLCQDSNMYASDKPKESLNIALGLNECFGYSAIAKHDGVFTAGNIHNAIDWETQSLQYWVRYKMLLKGSNTNPVRIILNAWGMKSVTLDGNPIDYAKDWKGTVERMDNSTAHTLKFEWYPLAQELKDAGYTYRANFDCYTVGSNTPTTSVPISATATEYSHSIYAGAAPSLYPFDLQLNLDKNGSSVGIFGNQHIVKLLVNEAPPEPPAPVAHSITITNTHGTANPTTAIAGETVTVKAKDWTGSNMMFTQWYAKTAGVTFTDATKQETTFVMPDRDVQVYPGYQQVSFTNQPTDSWLSAEDDSKVYFAFSQPITSWKLVNENDQTLASGDAADANALVAAKLTLQPENTVMTCRVIVTANGQDFTSNAFTLKWYKVPGAPDVTVYPAGGKFVETLSVNLKTPSTYWEIAYTTDGSDPYDKSGTEWLLTPSAKIVDDSTQVPISKDTTIKACLYNYDGPTNMQKFGDIVTCDFTKVELTPPVADPASGTSFYDSLNVSLSTDIVNAKIMWSDKDLDVDDLGLPGKWKEYEPEKESITLSGSYGMHGFYALTGIRMERPDGSTYWVHSDKQGYSYPRITYADMANASVTGKVNEEIIPVDISITLHGDVFAEDLTAGTDVSGWFTNRPTGLTAKVKERTNYTKTLVITISGTPTATSAAAISVEMPKSALRYTGTGTAIELTVLPNSNAVYNIVEDGTHTHSYGDWTMLDDSQHSRSCTCGDVQFEAHDFSAWMKVDDTNHSRTCSKCKKSGETANYTETAEHTWVWVVDQEAALNQPGKQHEECTGCHAKRSENTEIPALRDYAVTVTCGTATVAAGTPINRAMEGVAVTVTAQAPGGKHFVKWVVKAGGVTLANETSATTTFIMPANDVTIEAECAETPVEAYTLTVIKGTASVAAGTPITDKIEQNTVVTVTANAPETDKVFDKWVVLEGNVTLADATKATTTFTMPGNDVKIEATYKDAPPSHTHSYGTEWKYDGTNHWHECACGDKADIAAHSASEWIVDTAATETTDGAKHKECTVCKKVLETAPIPATGSTHTHSYGTDWKYDGTNHWHECECGDKADTAAHSFQWVIDKAATKEATGIKHEECTVCGAKRSENTVIDKLPDGGNTGNTGSGDNNTDKPGKDDSTKSPQTGDSSNLIGWLAALFVSGGVLTVLGVSSKKRKESEAE